MKILIVTDAYYPQVNGVVRTLHETGEILKSQTSSRWLRTILLRVHSTVLRMFCSDACQGGLEKYTSSPSQSSAVQIFHDWLDTILEADLEARWFAACISSYGTRQCSLYVVSDRGGRIIRYGLRAERR